MLPRMMRLLRHGVVFCVSRENVTSFHVLSFLWGCCVWLRPACTLVGVFHFCLGGGVSLSKDFCFSFFLGSVCKLIGCDRVCGLPFFFLAIFHVEQSS